MKQFEVLLTVLAGAALAVPGDSAQREQNAPVQGAQTSVQGVQPLTEDFKGHLCRVISSGRLCDKEIQECAHAATERGISDKEKYQEDVEKCFEETKKQDILRYWWKGNDIENTAYRNAVDQCRDIVVDIHNTTEILQCIHTQNKKLLAEGLSSLKTVWRGDSVSPTVYQELGGIPAEFNGSTTNLSYSLQWHHLGRGGARSAYTSTSYKLTAALFFATMDHRQDGWLYEIQTTPNMVDMVGSGINASFFEREFSAMGGVRWDQIRRYVKVPKENNIRGYSSWRNFETLEDIRQVFPEVELSWSTNNQYNEKFERYTASRGQPQLVGPLGEGQPAEEYMGKSLEEWATDFMDHTGWPVGWNGSFPLDLKASPDFSDTKLSAPVPVAAESV